MGKVPKTIAVFSPDNQYLSHCTWNRALKLLQSNRAIRINATTVRLKQTKKDRIRMKHQIIIEAKRICYICNQTIPEDETATIDHIIPKSRDNRADIPANMRCCCVRCNNDKGSLKLTEYVTYIKANREKYEYISDKRLKYLEHFAVHYEEDFYASVNVSSKDIRDNYNNLSCKKGRTYRK